MQIPSPIRSQFRIFFELTSPRSPVRRLGCQGRCHFQTRLWCRLPIFTAAKNIKDTFPRTSFQIRYTFLWMPSNVKHNLRNCVLRVRFLSFEKLNEAISSKLFRTSWERERKSREWKFEKETKVCRLSFDSRKGPYPYSLLTCAEAQLNLWK